MSSNPLSPMPPMMSPIGAPSGGPPRFSPIDPLRVLRQYARWLIVAAVVGGIVAVAAFIILNRYFTLYFSQAQLNVTSGLTDVMDVGQGIGQMQMDLLEADILNQTLRIKSDEVLDRALQREEIKSTIWYRRFKHVGEAREGLKEDLQVFAIKGSTVIAAKISGWGSYKDELPKIIDAVIDVYLTKVGGDLKTQNDSVNATFLAEHKRAQEDLDRIQRQISAFAKEHDMSALQPQANDATIRYQALATHYSEMQLALVAAREGYGQLLSTQQAGQLEYTSEALMEVEQDQAISYRNERIRSLRENRQLLVDRGYGENHRQVKDIDYQIAATELEKKKELDRLLRQRQEVQLQQARSMLEGLEGQYASLTQDLAAGRQEMQDLTLLLNQYEQLQTEAELTRERRDRAAERLDLLRIGASRKDSVRVQSIFRATEPELIFPKPAMVIPGVMLLILGGTAGIFFLRELLDQRIKSPADVKLLPDCELLGVVPATSEDPSGPAKIEGVVQADPSGLMAEAFRQLRGEILLRMDRRGFKSLLVVGAQPGCGTSAIASNLALIMAASERRVLLIDANFRRPSQHTMFHTSQQPGLVELLKQAVTLEDALLHVEEPSFDLLPTGGCQEASQELLGGPVFHSLMVDLQKQYDLILVDGPPALVTSDSLALSKHIDALALVVRALQDQRGMIYRLLRQFDGQHADVLGVIINGVLSSAGGYFKKNYEAFYRYRHGDVKKRKRTRTAAQL